MTLIRELNGIKPNYGENCWFAETAVIIGDVKMGDECSVWYNAVVRGDVHSIEMGNKVNVQDNAVIHCTYQKAKTVIGNNVSIGHTAIVHGCTLMDNVLIGMGAMVMDHAVVEEGALVAAGAIVLENTVVEAGYIYAGVPAKKIKLTEGNSKEMIERIANNYVKYASWYKD
ncbi:MAG: gamma carbonic anhydrase family protein [bacterium]|nr:gamma carbonic anhydrase family protein [bacterium]